MGNQPAKDPILETRLAEVIYRSPFAMNIFAPSEYFDLLTPTWTGAFSQSHEPFIMNFLLHSNVILYSYLSSSELKVSK